MMRQEINPPPHLALTFLALFILSVFFSIGIFMPTSDDLVLAYGQKIASSIPMDNWIETQENNHRFIPAFIEQFIQWWGYDYFHLTGFWIFGFASALWFCTREFVRYIKLPANLTPLFTLAIGLHGFWAEFMQFLIAYLDYAIGLMASGLTLLCARRYKNRPFLSISLVTLWIGIALASYQPMVLIPIFAISLAFIRDFFLSADIQKQRSLKDATPVIIGFFCAGLFFLMTYGLIPKPAHPLSFSWEKLFLNAGIYILTLPTLFLPLLSSFSYYLIFPIHERLIYALAQIVAGIVLFNAPPSKGRSLALGGLLLCILLSAGPMSIFVSYNSLITPRSMAPAAFFHVGLTFILVLASMSYLKQRYLNWPHKGLFFGALFTLIGLSFANQLSIVYERARQYVHDEAIGFNILADLKEKGALYAGSPMVVVSASPYHIAQLTRVFFIHFPLSTFWANLSTGVPMLSRLSGIPLKRITYGDLWHKVLNIPENSPNPVLQIYEALCGDISMPWEIRKKEDITVICLAQKGSP